MPETDLIRELARLGAREAYVDYQRKLDAIAAAFPEVVDPDRPVARRKMGTRRKMKKAKVVKRARQPARAAAPIEQADTKNARVVQALLATMPFNEPMKADELRIRVAGMVGNANADAIKRALAHLVKTKMVKHEGWARGTRYTLLKKAS